LWPFGLELTHFEKALIITQKYQAWIVPSILQESCVLTKVVAFWLEGAYTIYFYVGRSKLQNDDYDLIL
jgi:hypothetical protein